MDILRPPNNLEKQEILKELNKIGASIPQKYLMCIHELKYAELFIIKDNLLHETVYEISKFHNVYFAGIYGGSFKNKKFKLSLDLAEHLYRLGKLNNTLVVNDRLAAKFLYGKDITLERIADKESLFLILNTKKDVLGIGKTVVGSRVIINLVDKGWYLRRGG